MTRLEQTIYNLKATRKMPPTDEILEGRTMDEYYHDEAIFMMNFEDAINEQTEQELDAFLSSR
jgi:hypothetical protein